MPKYRLAPAAKTDIANTLNRTHDQFGEAARFRFELLLIQAMHDVVEKPDLPGSHPQTDLSKTAWTYHLIHSRNHVPSKLGRVKRPRHFLLYRPLADGTTEIARVLHDAVDLPRHVPNKYRPDSAGD